MCSKNFRRNYVRAKTVRVNKKEAEPCKGEVKQA